jgi:hypothetical protein
MVNKNIREQFFREEYISLLKKLKFDDRGNWGVLSPQGMVEHMTDSIAISYERIVYPLHTPQEFLEKAKSFAISDKEFKPNTKNALMTDDPAPLRNHSLQEAILELENEIQLFLGYFKKFPDKKTLNPFFGELNYQDWLTLLHKHARHHLKQFNLE